MRVILTAAVTPQITQHLSLADHHVRRQQYIDSLKCWASLAYRRDFTLTLVENSGENLKHLARMAWNEELPFVQLVNAPEPEPTSASRGKGAVEGLMLDFAVRHLPPSSASEMVYKCTGRLAVPNFHIAAIKENTQPCLVVEIPRKPSNWFDSRLFGASRHLWETQLAGLGNTVDDASNRNLEHALADLAVGLRRQEGVEVRNFRSKPIFRGQSGTSGQRYDDARSRLYSVLRVPADITRRRFLPGFGTSWLSKGYSDGNDG